MSIADLFILASTPTPDPMQYYLEQSLSARCRHPWSPRLKQRLDPCDTTPVRRSMPPDRYEWTCLLCSTFGGTNKYYYPLHHIEWTFLTYSTAMRGKAIERVHSLYHTSFLSELNVEREEALGARLGGYFLM